MVYRVAVIGHSNVPKVYSFDDVEITFIKERGAEIKHVYDKLAPRILHRSWDVVIVFLGGNDLCHRTADQVAADLIRLAHDLDAHKVVITSIEPRTYSPAKQILYGITNEEYKARATAINGKLKTKARCTKDFRIINCCPRYNYNSPDGIHFNQVAKRSLVTKYIAAIRHFVERGE